MSPSQPADGTPPRVVLPHRDQDALALTTAVRAGDLAGLARLLDGRPELATARMTGRDGVSGGWRTALHVAADWPGYFPAAPDTVGVLLAAGADPNDDTGGARPETPLHWAASSDDVDVAVVLVEGGARIDTPGGSIGTPLDNAVGYGCWHVARLLVERGAAVDALWHAAALGMLDRLRHLLAGCRVGDDRVSQAFWHACAAGERRAAELLLAHGADLGWVPEYGGGTAFDAAGAPSTRQQNVVSWLRGLDRAGPA